MKSESHVHRIGLIEDRFQARVRRRLATRYGGRLSAAAFLQIQTQRITNNVAIRAG